MNKRMDSLNKYRQVSTIINITFIQIGLFVMCEEE
jgi:hypothetical protein